VLSIRILKIGLKDAKQYIDPYMSVYVKGLLCFLLPFSAVEVKRRACILVVMSDCHTLNTVLSIILGLVILM
jgi:hypothetical protein